SSNEASKSELSRQATTASAQAELARKELSRATRELNEYRAKANHILAMKDKLIASLRGPHKNSYNSEPDSALSASSSDLSPTTLHQDTVALHAEIRLLREEHARFRLKDEAHQVSMQELELLRQTEQESQKKNIALLEEQVEKERQVGTSLARSRLLGNAHFNVLIHL
ncbi:unnamed protein product, partial [Protopolystoma xenopodis]